jgi:TatD DNase family protein
VDQEWVILEARYAKSFHTSLEKLITCPDGRKYCVAIGEIGLDYHGKSFNPLHQRQVFRKLLSLASKHSLPLYLHNRDAHSDLLSILKPFLSHTMAVVHCHTDPSLKNLKELLAAGVYVGLTGIIADKRVGRVNGEIVGEIPLHKMMIETDAPFLMPRNVPKDAWGERNEACLLPFVVRKIAQMRGDCTDREVAESTRRVAKEFFGL